MVGSWLVAVTAPRDHHGFSLGTGALRRIACSRRSPHAFARVSRRAPQADSRKRGLVRALHRADIVCELASPREPGTDGTLLPSRAAAPTRRLILRVDGFTLDCKQRRDWPTVLNGCGLAMYGSQRRLCGEKIRAADVAEGSVSISREPDLDGGKLTLSE
jgi:hypothetical protein